MVFSGTNWGRLICMVASAVMITTTTAQAQSFSNQRQEQYVPTTWVDPDGCEHWVMDDGAEGFMTPKYYSDGRPVCNAPSRPATQCGRATDQYFRTDSYSVSSDGRARLLEFFNQNRGQQFIIVGHTDSRASYEYNDRLSLNRARSVAEIAKSVGARVIEVRGEGERNPIATNGTVEGQAQNRRVDILCTTGTSMSRSSTVVNGGTPYVERPRSTPRPAPKQDIMLRLQPLAELPQGDTSWACGPNGPLNGSNYTGKVCGRLPNQYFATGSYNISAEGRAELAQFFQENAGKRFAIVGHTDSRSSDAYNMQLSLNRAKTVAVIGQLVGANIVDVRGMGERQPIASNDTLIGMAQNRRVDIICVD